MPAEQFDIPPAMPVGVLVFMFVVAVATSFFYVEDHHDADERRAATVAAIEDHDELDVTDVLDASEDELRFVAVDDGTTVECTASVPGDFVMLVCDVP